ncbi:MAG: VWA domain-containing protein [Acidobacteriota bacterium]
MPALKLTTGAPLCALGSALLCLVSAAASGQVGERPSADTFKDQTEVSSILVPVTVKDSRGRLVATLDEKKFHLLVDGIEFPITSFWREGGLPLSVALVVDTSGSMGGRRLRRAREAILDFLRQRGPGDEVCLITFGAGEVKRRLKFGTDPDLLPRVLESLKGYGTTALYDVLTASRQVMEGAKNIRRVILLFTDGVDTASKMTPDDAVRVLEGLDDPLYAFGIEPPPADQGPPDSYEQLLQRFSAASGGRYIRVDDAANLPAFCRELRRELTMRYIIAFQPGGIGTSKYRKLEVRVDGAYQVLARQGYRGTLP